MGANSLTDFLALAEKLFTAVDDVRELVRVERASPSLGVEELRLARGHGTKKTSSRVPCSPTEG